MLHEIIEFDIAILIGLVAGAYSSIFLSSPLWAILEYRSYKKDNNKNNTKKEKRKKKKPEELMVKGINS